ncbi:MAG: histidine phosphatase family protein [bacterium]|nr:histidine phosphatase family protein [bacterium]
MKVLYIVRHAKSSWDYSELSDFERPLTARGRRDAPFMAGIIREQNEPPFVIVSSSALRAVTTARTFATELGLPLASMVITNALYEAGTQEALNVVHRIDNNVKTAMIVGHNPTMTSLVNTISDIQLENIPTCGCVKIAFPNADVWTDIDKSSGKLMMFEYPKKYFPE